MVIDIEKHKYKTSTEELCTLSIIFLLISLISHKLY